MAHTLANSIISSDKNAVFNTNMFKTFLKEVFTSSECSLPSGTVVKSLGDTKVQGSNPQVAKSCLPTMWQFVYAACFQIFLKVILSHSAWFPQFTIAVNLFGIRLN